MVKPKKKKVVSDEDSANVADEAADKAAKIEALLAIPEAERTDEDKENLARFQAP